MRGLNDTLERIAALRARPRAAPGTTGPDRLSDLRDFGANPGALRARFYRPRHLEAGAALVVVLHGCTQNAAGYDRGSGWSQLAEEYGFAVLFPEQQRANNANLCFNWFSTEDTRRDSGEALSIRQMIAAMIVEHHLDPARVYVTGLSAGGAMTSVMLATYPEVFAGGAIIAGLPYGTAASVPEAFDRMRGHGGPRASALGALIVSASNHEGPWPTVSIWHGDSDATVTPANADLIVEQWRAVHGVSTAPSQSELAPGRLRRAWRDAEGREVIEEYRIAGLGHGTPLISSGAEACGVPGPYMLEAGISSTRRIASFWNLGQAVRTQAPGDLEPGIRSPTAAGPEASPRVDRGEHPPGQVNVGRIIEDALRAAGLMR